MISFEQWYKEFKIKEECESESKASDIIYAFCLYTLLSEKDSIIFNYYLQGKKQREISLLLNMHQPLVSRSIRLTKRILKHVGLFLRREDIVESLEVAKNLFTKNEYNILNFRLVGYTFQDIANEMKTTVQYSGLAHKYLIKKFEKHLNNNHVSILYKYLKNINSYWRKKK